MLIDSVEITVQAGRGGDGIVAWRREKFVPKGGPDGGDGGWGGSVVFIGSNNLDTLSSFRYRKVFKAEDGETGRSKRQHGSNGADLELLVPEGTIVTDVESGKALCDITKNAERVVIAKGGKGGLGNPHFATSTHQRPEEATAGKPGQQRQLRLELQLIADVALIGQPNAGKSSLISALTGVESRIGAYPFSTVEPVLGVLHDGDERLTLIDLPGLIEGAHKGRGLGDKFLKHLSRVRQVVHVVDATTPKPTAAIEEIERELREYDPDLLKKPRLLVFNKIDLLSTEEKTDLTTNFPHAITVSAQDQTNLNVLREALLRHHNGA